MQFTKKPESKYVYKENISYQVGYPESTECNQFITAFLDACATPILVLHLYPEITMIIRLNLVHELIKRLYLRTARNVWHNCIIDYRRK